MKKIIVLAAVVIMAACSQAAAFKWTARNVMDPEDTSAKWSGAIEIFMSVAGDDSFTKVADATISAGVLNYTATLDSAVGGTSYDFYFTAKDGDYLYTSTTVAGIAAHATQTKNVGFTGGSWTTTAVPEPTSGLLMLVGLAGLALRRRRA